MYIISFIAMILSMGILMLCDIMSLGVWTVLFKCLASLFFIITAILAYKKGSVAKSYFICMLTAFLFCFGGDTALAFGSDGLPFLLGVGSFSIGHLAFAAAYINQTKLKKMDLLRFAIIFIPCLILILSGPFDYQGMKPLVILYLIIISTMVSKSLAMYQFHKQNSSFVTMTILGSFLFLVSDLILLFLFFLPDATPRLQEVNWLLYYVGQGILAMSLAQYHD